MRTVEDVKPIAAQVIAENPDVVNPRDGSTCVYEAVGKPEPGEAPNCIAATILIKMDLPVPGEDGSISDILHQDETYEDEFDPEAISFMQALQAEADGDHNDDAQRVQWGKIDLDVIESSVRA